MIPDRIKSVISTYTQTFSPEITVEFEFKNILIKKLLILTFTIKKDSIPSSTLDLIPRHKLHSIALSLLNAFKDAARKYEDDEHLSLDIPHFLEDARFTESKDCFTQKTIIPLSRKTYLELLRIDNEHEFFLTILPAKLNKQLASSLSFYFKNSVVRTFYDRYGLSLLEGLPPLLMEYFNTRRRENNSISTTTPGRVFLSPVPEQNPTGFKVQITGALYQGLLTSNGKIKDFLKDVFWSEVSGSINVHNYNLSGKKDEIGDFLSMRIHFSLLDCIENSSIERKENLITVLSPTVTRKRLLKLLLFKKTHYGEKHIDITSINCSLEEELRILIAEKLNVSSEGEVEDLYSLFRFLDWYAEVEKDYYCDERDRKTMHKFIKSTPEDKEVILKAYSEPIWKESDVPDPIPDWLKF